MSAFGGSSPGVKVSSASATWHTIRWSSTDTFSRKKTEHRGDLRPQESREVSYGIFLSTPSTCT